MTAIRSVALTIAMLILGTNAFGNNPSPGEILKKVAATYKSMKTYKVEITVTSEIEKKLGGRIRKDAEFSFSILLKKPNLYLITWTQKNLKPGKVRSWALWSDGTQPYYYNSIPNYYCKLKSDEIALKYIEEIRGLFNIYSRIPSLFLQVGKEHEVPFFWLKDPKLEKVEKIGEEDCYVISGTSATSIRETIWVSKTSYLVRKYYRLEDLLKIVQQKTGINYKLIKIDDKHRKLLEEDIKNRTTTYSYTEIHEEISSPELDKSDFNFVFPEGAVLRDALFDLGDNS